MNFGKRFLAPMALIVAASLATLGLGLVWLTQLQDELAEAREVELTASAVNGRVERMRTFVREYAYWDEAARHMALTLDTAWADDNVGIYAYNLNKFEYVLAVTPADTAIYAVVDGKHAPIDPAVALGAGYVRAARELVRAERADADAPIAGITLTGRGPAFFGIARIRPSSNEVRMPQDLRRYLVVAKLIDPAVMGEISKATLGAPIRLASAGSDAGNGRLALVDADGGEAGTLTWETAKPGSALRLRLLPLVALIALAICGLAAMVLSRARRAAGQLSSSEANAIHLANHDSLTGLPNRRAFNEYLLRQSRSGEPYVIVYMDLDGFKDVNDAFGHATGDALLRRTADRLKAICPRGALLARLGGDEFAYVVEGVLPEASLDALARGIVEAVRDPHDLRTEPIVVGTSVGIAASDGTDFEDVVRRADIAMYTAKARGRDGWCLFDPSLDDGRIERMVLECELRRAIEARELSVVFQPIMRSRDESIASVEALARWDHPTRGHIPPDVFIPIAEESGLIIELGRYVLREACMAARDWPFALAVNLSPAQFWDRTLVDGVLATLDECGFPPERLEFEITETYLLRRPEAAAEVIAQLRKHGIRMALDDFGTGYASIGYLQRFELDLVKLDRSFVEHVATDSDAADVALAIIALGSALRLPILAEGVETPEQAALLTTAGCAYMQGWHYGRPMSAAAIGARFTGDEASTQRSIAA